MSEKMKVALCQMSVCSDKERNIETACRMIRESVSNGAGLVVLPECFNSPYGTSYFDKYAEEVPNGRTTNALLLISKELGVYIIGGSIPERRDGKLYNTCVVVGPDGILEKYSKLHLFNIDVPGKITFFESSVLSPGNSICTFSIGQWKIGVGICFDMRFPELARVLLDEGCNLLVYPGAFHMVTGKAHWKLNARARAVDNQCYTMLCSPARDTTADYVAWGHSIIVDPWGKVLNECDADEAVVYENIDLSRVEEVRKQLPINAGRRRDMIVVTHSC